MISQIIFYDGSFHKLPKSLKDKYFILNAKDGFSPNQSLIEFLANSDQEVKILTNDLLAWGNDIAWWNEKEHKCQAYILSQINNEWKKANIQDLIEKEIRKAHNIVRMYMANSFSDKPVCYEKIKCPKYATLLSKNIRYPIYNIHFDTKQVTLEEKENKVYNTVSINDVDFDFSHMTIGEAVLLQVSFLHYKRIT